MKPGPGTPRAWGPSYPDNSPVNLTEPYNFTEPSSDTTTGSFTGTGDQTTVTSGHTGVPSTWDSFSSSSSSSPTSSTSSSPSSWAGGGDRWTGDGAATQPSNDSVSLSPGWDGPDREALTRRAWITEDSTGEPSIPGNVRDYTSEWSPTGSPGPSLSAEEEQGNATAVYEWLNSSRLAEYTPNRTSSTPSTPYTSTEYFNITGIYPYTTTTTPPSSSLSSSQLTTTCCITTNNNYTTTTTNITISNLTSLFTSNTSFTSLVDNSSRSPNVLDMEPTIPCEGVVCIDFYQEFTYNFTNTSLEGDAIENEKNWEVLLLLIVVFAGIMGNVLVCIAVSLEKKLQNITNYFLMSLAVADLFVSLVVMPCSIVHEFMGYWPFGLVVCDLWQVADVMMCTSSIMHMCTISLDRYTGIRNPLRTRSKSRSNVAIKIAVVWVISLALASPIILLSLLNPENILSGGICAIFNHYFLIYGSLAAFFIPLLIMFIAYSLTIHLLHKQAKRCSKRSNKDVPLMRRSTSCRKKDTRCNVRANEQRTISRMQNSNGLHISHTIQKHLERNNAHSSEREPLHEDRCDSETNQLLPKKLDSRESSESPARTPRLQVLVKKHGAAIKAASYLIQKKDERRELNSVKTEQKAVKVLGTMFAIFVICWAPFFSLNFAMGVCESCDIDVSVFKVFLWLGYVSSTLNPIIYTIFNKTFKRTFIKILTCQLRTKRKSRKAGTYTTNNGSSIRVKYETTNESAV